MKILSQGRGKLKNATRQEIAINPATKKKNMTFSTEIDICRCILAVRGTARLEFGNLKGGERSRIGADGCQLACRRGSSGASRDHTPSRLGT